MNCRSNSWEVALKTALAVFASTSLANCATDGPELACGDIDWRAEGLADGQAGEKKTRYNNLADTCEDEGLTGDAKTYLAGYTQGLAAYCAPAGAFRAGLEGGDYGDVCAPEVETAFLEEFQLGRKLRRLTRRADRADETFRRAEQALSHHKIGLSNATSRYDNPYLSGADRYAARQDVDYHRREVDRYSTDLPGFRAEADDARKSLAAFKEDLAAQGREIPEEE